MRWFAYSVVVCTVLSLTIPAWSESTHFFRGCTATGARFESHTMTLSPDSTISKQTVYFIHNKTRTSLNLMLMKNMSHPYLSYKNQIGPQEWAVFAMDEPSLDFACQQTGQHGHVNCQDVIELCQYVNIKFPPGNHGNYWAVPSSSLITARKEIVKQGILLRW